jgi:hypothetical protein
LGPLEYLLPKIADAVTDFTFPIWQYLVWSRHCKNPILAGFLKNVIFCLWHGSIRGFVVQIDGQMSRKKKRKYQRPSLTRIAAEVLGVTYFHLHRCLNGERQSLRLMRRYNEWLQQRNSTPAADKTL